MENVIKKESIFTSCFRLYGLIQFKCVLQICLLGTLHILVNIVDKYNINI